MAAARGVSGCRRGRLSPWPESARSGQQAPGSSAGDDGGGPRCVWPSRWHVVALVGAGNEPPSDPRGVRWRGCWRPEVCPGSVVMPLPEVAGAGSEVVGSHWTVWWCGWRKPEVCPGFGGQGVAGRAGAGSEAVGGQWSDCWRGWWRSEICPVLPEVQHRRKSLWRICWKRQQGRHRAVYEPLVGGAVGGPFLFGQGIGSVCGKVTPVAVLSESGVPNPAIAFDATGASSTVS